MTIRNLIVDTDYNTDVGDVGAVSVALSAHRIGWVNLLGFIVNTSYSKVPGAVNAHATWWGLSSGLVYGCWKGFSHEATAPSNNVPGYLYDNFPHALGLANTVTDSTVAYRTMLASARDGSVDICSIGFMMCLSALLDSPADSISSLTGAQLVAAKVGTLYVMGGVYPSGSEYNFMGASYSIANVCATTANVCSNWPTPIRYIGFELGTFTAGGTFGRPTTDFVSAAYTTSTSTSGNTAWDEQCILAAIQNCSDFSLTYGSNAVNSSTGANVFSASASGKDAFLRRTVPDAQMQAKLNKLISVTVTSNPILSSWDGAPGLLQVRAS
mgnify:CR=1 FL=1